MLQKLYTLLIKPRQQSEDDRNREIVLNVLLAGTLLILLLSLPLLSIGYLLLHHDYFSPSMLMVTTAVLFIGYLYRLSRKGHFRIAASLLVGMYFLLATTVVFLWGINVPAGVLLFGLVIVLAGILLGSVGGSSVYWINSLTFLAVIGALLMMRFEDRVSPGAPESTSPRSSTGFVLSGRTI